MIVFAAIAAVLAGCARTDAPTVVIARPAADILPAASSVIIAVGDLVCGAQTAGNLCVHNETAALTSQSSPAAVLVLGDNQYENGSYAGYTTYYDQSWGAFKSITHPVPGNHEYHTANASGYFDYFNGVGVQNGPAGQRGKGYYSTNLNGWHLVMLKPTAQTYLGGARPDHRRSSGCAQTSPPTRSACTLATWHIPRFSSGNHGSNTASTDLWKALYDFGADVVLVGHDHNYERFAPQTHLGQRDDAFGIREFVVGTGGEELKGPGTPAPNSELFDNTSMGVLRMTLHANGYGWRFVSIPDTRRQTRDRPHATAFRLVRRRRLPRRELHHHLSEYDCAEFLHGGRGSFHG